MNYFVAIIIPLVRGEKKTTRVGRAIDHVKKSKSDYNCSEPSLYYMIVDIPEFKLMQELKIYKMEAEISLVCLTFKEIKDL